MNKREFIVGSVALACASATPVLSDSTGLQTAAAFPVRSRRRLPNIAAAPDLDAWRAYVGQRFDLRGSAGSVEAVLEQVREVRRDDRTEQFTLLFDCASAAAVPAGLHELRHPNGQKMILHLEEIGPSERARCAAHFGRLV